VADAWTKPSGWLPRRLRDLRTHLNLALVHGDADEVERILDAGVDPVGARTRTLERTVAHQAVHLDRPELVHRLLAAGGDIEATDTAGSTPLQLALHIGAVPAVVQALLDAGAKPPASSDPDS
jgi:ankyrin repeat protein